MTNLDSILKSRDNTLPTKVLLVKAMVFPVVMYGCESWTVKKAEHRRIDAFELWCWRRLLGVPWMARRSNQSILKEISPEYSLMPTRLLRPWDFPGKSTGVSCHCLLQCMKVKSQSEVIQSCLTLSDPIGCSLPGSSIHKIFQARVLEWGAIAFSEIML